MKLKKDIPEAFDQSDYTVQAVTLLGVPGWITVNRKASIFFKQTPSAGKWYGEIGISDPTTENTGLINVDLGNLPSTLVTFKCPEITVTQSSPTLKFTVNVNGSQGKTYYIRFREN